MTNSHETELVTCWRLCHTHVRTHEPTHARTHACSHTHNTHARTYAHTHAHTQAKLLVAWSHLPSEPALGHLCITHDQVLGVGAGKSSSGKLQ